MNKIHLPSLKGINKIIEDIGNINLSSITINEIKEMHDPLFKGYSLSSPNFHPGLILYRGIKYNDMPKLLSELSYPPKEYAKTNRASREGEQIFYCSNSMYVPYYELGLVTGDTLVISKWKTTEKLLVNNIGYTASNFNNLGSNRSHYNFWNQPSIKKKHEFSYKNDIVANYLAKTFSQKVGKENVDLYKLTIAIAEAHYGGSITENDKLKHFVGNKFQGLLYPTIPMKGNADNFAIYSEFVDSGGLIFEDVFFIRIDNFDEISYKIKCLNWANSISDTGEIEWKGRMPQWDLKDDDIVTRGPAQEIIVKDKYGNILPPY